MDMPFGGADKAFYDELARTNPAAAAAYLNQHILKQGSPEAKATQAQINGLAGHTSFTPTPLKKASAINPFSAMLNPATNIKNIAGAGIAKSNAQQKAILEAILPGMLQGVLGNPKTSKKVTTSSKTKAKGPQ